MRGRWNGSVAGLLRLTFTVLLSLVVLVGGLAIAESLRYQTSLRQLSQHITPLRLTNLQLRSTMGDATRGLRNHLIHGEPDTLYLQARSRHRAQLDRMESYADRPGLYDDVRTWRRLTEEYFAYADRANAIPRGSGRTLEYANGARRRYEGLLRFSDGLEGRLEERARDLDEQAQRQRLWIQTGVIAAVLLALALAAFTALRTYRALLPPLRAMDRTLRRITAGDLDARAPTSGPVEIRTVGATINTLAEEASRMRRAEKKRARLARVAYEASTVIRRTLDTDQVVREAATALGTKLPAGAVYVELITDERVGAVEVEWSDGALAPVPRTFPSIDAEQVQRTYDAEFVASGRTLDPPDYMPEDVVEAFRELGDMEFMVIMFGAGTVALGALLLTRPAERGPWTDEEIAAVKSVGSELGRGLEQARLYARERELVEELRALDVAKTDFISTVSHELRSPLTSIAGYVELLRDEDAGDVNPAQDRMLDAIERNTTRLRLLIEDLLTLSRIESGAFRTVRQPLDLCTIVEGAVESMRPVAAKHDVRLTVDLSSMPVVVDGDANQIDRAVVNLVSNAIKFTPAEGRIVLTVRTRGDAATLVISDTGIGIPAGEMQRMTDRFFRASNATARSIPGTGLGLSIVRSIVANHSGAFELDSVEGEGTTVTIRIPLTGAPPAETPG
ncbi:HAMP domain-containing sensor histidine kinase [Spirillospora albida]|uniref:HAMP domain-containing sensor histidine kinase n=1 Tax=Spirillospora albida TaxID=58123 RepID=UPI00068C9586|nr:ATP-binding protein [Spirillospora albida]